MQRPFVSGGFRMVARWMCFLVAIGLGFTPQAEGRQSSQVQSSQRPSPLVPRGAPLVYTIGGGDVINILVWKEPDFSGNFLVRYDGRITLPVVGDVMVAGRTPEQVSKLLEKELSRYIESARVTVTVFEANSARFYVIGKVAQQGSFPYIGPIRVVQALALAGGFQEFAKLARIFVIREVKGNLIYFPVDYDNLVSQRNLEVNIPLLPGDTIVVP